jgi:hypothetical protein
MSVAVSNTLDMGGEFVIDIFHESDRYVPYGSPGLPKAGVNRDIECTN